MNERERYVATLLFEKVDKVPFMPGGPRESTLKRWKKEGLPENKDWFEFVCEEIGVKIEKPSTPRVPFYASLNMIPEFEEKIIERKDNHLIVQTSKGEIVEIDGKYDFSYLRSAKDFVTRKWHKFPVENRDDWEKLKERYNPETPERYPEDFEENAEIIRNRDYIWSFGINGPFWKLRDWCGFENLCIMMATEPDFVMEMCNFWKDFVVKVLTKLLEKCAPDSVIINEDMAYKEKCMVSPEMVKRFLAPVWKTWSDLLREYGCEIIILDSDGYIEELIPIWIENGINCTIPVEIAAGNDPVKYRKKFGKKMAYIGGIDKRAIAKGGKVIEKEIESKVPFLLKDGGYIPGCDHGVPPDISLQNFIHYCKIIAKLTGWI